MITRLEAPAKYRSDVNVWVDEAIWGHRLYNDQTPWLVLLEFLAIFQSRNAEGKALNESRIEGGHETFTYYIPRLVPLRQLIFNNPHIRYVEDNFQSDPERWREWLKSFSSDDDFGYLQNRFGRFARLSRIIELFKRLQLNHIVNVGGRPDFYFLTVLTAFLQTCRRM